MTVIYFVRHGRTDWNHQGLFRGRADRPLDDVGIRHSELVRDALAPKKLKHLYASPMQRTIGTLSKLSARMNHKPIHGAKGLIDIDYGKWQGVKKEDAQSQWPDLWRTWHEDPFSVTFPDGESLKDVQARALADINQIVKESEGYPVVVCTHRVVLKALFCGFVDAQSPQAFYSFKVDPGSISIVQFKDDLPVIVTLNDTRHIRGDDPLGGPEDF
jgi:broad specificity phosphatase PhoE